MQALSVELLTSSILSRLQKCHHLFSACHLSKVCRTTNDTRLTEYRRFVQGATVSFFITELQGRLDAINYIVDPTKSPLRLLIDKSDLHC